MIKMTDIQFRRRLAVPPRGACGAPTMTSPAVAHRWVRSTNPRFASAILTTSSAIPWAAASAAAWAPACHWSTSVNRLSGRGLYVGREVRELIPDGPCGTPTAFKDGGRWLLFYERSDKGVWLATSDDLKVWKNVRDEPVLVPGPGAYDRDMVALNQVVRHGGRYYAYYHGCATTGPDARKWSTAVAVSDDLIRWEKYPGNPLLPVVENKSSGVLVDTGAGFRLYTMNPAVHLHAPATP